MNRKIDFDVNFILNYAGCITLPIDVHEIARRCGYNVRNYSYCQELIERLNLKEYLKKYPAFSIKYDDAFYILVSDNLPVDSECKAIAHEIGHIKLHDMNPSGVFGICEDKTLTAKQEKEADDFALRLLAPLPFLNKHKIRSPEDIKRLTNLCIADSCTVFENLRDYREESSVMYECHKLEERYNLPSHRSHKWLKFILVLVIFFVVSIFGSYITGNQAKNNSNTSVNDYQVSNKSSQLDTTYDTNITYYWTDDGEVYHIYHDCQSLKNSLKIRSGSFEEAEDYKERLCKFCQNRNNNEHEKQMKSN